MPKNPVIDPITDQEAGGMRKLNISRDQILTRLWELATLSHEATRGTIAGQIRALSMIVAIEGLIPDRRNSSSRTQPAAPPVEPDIWSPDWLREQQQQPAVEEPTDAIAATEAPPAVPPVANPFINPEPLNRVPGATGGISDVIRDRANSLRLPFSLDRRFSGRRPGRR